MGQINKGIFYFFLFLSSHHCYSQSDSSVHFGVDFLINPMLHVMKDAKSATNIGSGMLFYIKAGRFIQLRFGALYHLQEYEVIKENSSHVITTEHFNYLTIPITFDFNILNKPEFESGISLGAANGFPLYHGGKSKVTLTDYMGDSNTCLQLGIWSAKKLSNRLKLKAEIFYRRFMGTVKYGEEYTIGGMMYPSSFIGATSGNHSRTTLAFYLNLSCEIFSVTPSKR